MYSQHHEITYHYCNRLNCQMLSLLTPSNGAETQSGATQHTTSWHTVHNCECTVAANLTQILAGRQFGKLRVQTSTEGEKLTVQRGLRVRSWQRVQRWSRPADGRAEHSSCILLLHTQGQPLFCKHFLCCACPNHPIMAGVKLHSALLQEAWTKT